MIAILHRTGSPGNNLWVFILCGLFLALNLYFISLDFYLVSLLPLALLFILIALQSLETIFYITIFLVPLSIPLQEIVPDTAVNLSLPGELFLIGITFLYLYKLLRAKEINLRILKHPITLAIIFYLTWIFITSITSSMPLVSFKYFATRLWFIIPFYFLALKVFYNERNIRRYLWAYLASLTLVVLFTLWTQGQEGLINQQASHSASRPFYNDHTAYGAVLAFYFPVLAGFVLDKRLSGYVRWMALGLGVLFFFAIVFSYTRAAWVSLLGALVVLVVILMRIRFLTLSLFGVVLLAYLLMFAPEIKMKLEGNKQTSSKEFTEHLQSIANVTSDASNAERLNRWRSALRMFGERPIVGWGPGTYQFVYAPFQFTREKTFISTNFGDRGNAHSEYIGPLSESGIGGMASVLLLVVVTILTGLRIYKKSLDRGTRILILSVLLGLVTYFLHGLLNNFLDSDKLSAPFWGFIAILVALDITPSQEKKDMGENVDSGQVKSGI